MLTSALTVSTQASSEQCGCADRIDFDSSGEEGRLATVLARVVLAEGSPRSPHRADADNAHPYPWLRYLVTVEKRWGDDVPAELWIERPWAACGSVLKLYQRYLIALPKRPDLKATQIAGNSVLTIDACTALRPVEEAADAISALGVPTWDKDTVSEASRQTVENAVSTLFATRRDCHNRVRVDQQSFTMSPGVPLGVKVTLADSGEDASATQEFYFAQDATRGDGRGRVLVQATNPTPCWLQVTPEIQSTWEVKEGVRRPFFPQPGLTFVDGWIPPFWSGVVTVDQDALWIREVRWSVTGMPIVSSAPPDQGIETEQLRDAAGALAVLSVNPEAGAKLKPDMRLSAMVRWTPSVDVSSLQGYSLSPLFINHDGTMTMRNTRLQGAALQDLGPKELTGAAVAGRPIDIQVEIDLKSNLEGRSAALPIKLVFSLQKRIDFGDDPSATTIVALTAPLEYSLARPLPSKPLLPPKLGAYYSGGDGSSCGEAVVVRGVDTVQQGISAERHWWRTVFPGSQMQSQGVIPPSEEGGRAFDTVTLRLRSGEEETVCFDITAFWGASAR